MLGGIGSIPGAALGGLDLTEDQLAAVARDLAGHADIEEERAVG